MTGSERALAVVFGAVLLALLLYARAYLNREALQRLGDVGLTQECTPLLCLTRKRRPSNE